MIRWMAEVVLGAVGMVACISALGSSWIGWSALRVEMTALGPLVLLYFALEPLERRSCGIGG